MLLSSRPRREELAAWEELATLKKVRLGKDWLTEEEAKKVRASQFNREHKRHFGRPPIRDVELL